MIRLYKRLQSFFVVCLARVDLRMAVLANDQYPSMSGKQNLRPFGTVFEAFEVIELPYLVGLDFCFAVTQFADVF